MRQLTTCVDAADVPAAEALLNLAGAVALSAKDADGTTLLEPPVGELPLWPRVVLRALFPRGTDLDAVRKLLEQSMDYDLRVEIAEIGPDDWQSSLCQPFDEQAVGHRIRLVPADRETTASTRTDIRLHMGLAFGTGRHPTTRLCLEWLDAQPMSGERVLDYGCGSGILAITALRLGAERAWATDVEPQALAATARNARLNGVTERLWVGSDRQLPKIEATLILANILSGTLCELATTFAAATGERGRIVLSGMLEEQTDVVKAAYRRYFRDFVVRTAEGWACLSARKM